MTTRMQRTQILIEPAQHQALTEIARREQRSLSDVVREMLQAQLEQRRQGATAVQERRLQALAQIRQHRQLILDRRGGKPLKGDAVEFINQMRDERDGEISSVIHLVNPGPMTAFTWPWLKNWAGRSLRG